MDHNAIVNVFDSENLYMYAKIHDESCSFCKGSISFDGHLYQPDSQPFEDVFEMEEANATFRAAKFLMEDGSEDNDSRGQEISGMFFLSLIYVLCSIISQ